MEHRLVLRADEEFELIEVNGNTEPEVQEI